MKKCLLLFWVACICPLVAFADDQIQKQFAEYYAQTSSRESGVRRYWTEIREDGTWADVDYTSQRRGDWPTRIHLDRLNDLAAVYADPTSDYYQNEALKQSVLNGLEHWIEKDYQNPNWYNARIGVPHRLGSALVLMGEAVPKEMLAAARPILLRSEMGMTGQNKVWCAGNNIMIGLLYDEPERLEEAVAQIWSELRVSAEEGIQLDWSFHQHGPQQQFGNYGLSFASDMIKWALILRGTEHELSGEQLFNLRNYMLEGVSWIIWNGRMDFSGCGRQIDEGAMAGKGRKTMRQLELMKAVDPDFADEYDAVLERVGFNPFWRSEMGVQRRPDWYASVKMSSKRVIGAETCNSENMQGIHQGDGTLLVYRDGSEYEDIVPLWDWKRLPGTTCDQGFQSLEPGEADQGIGISDFSGLIGDGETGMAAMIYERNELTAHKSYFFFEDHIVCLGAGISGETKGDVYTSVEQCWLKDEVKDEKGLIVHNKNLYAISDGKFAVESGVVDGNWNASFPTRGSRSASGDVFNVWINHGKSPKDATYTYRVYPANGNSFPEITSEIIANTKKVQAVMCGWDVYAVFYEPGKLKLGNEWIFEVNAPCLLHFSNEESSVVDPLHSSQTLEIKVNGKMVEVEFPQGASLGKQVKVK